jgi:NAD(P)-dependent dehydrogenase (short-subunit alcohol dehydrogenase family)
MFGSTCGPFLPDLTDYTTEQWDNIFRTNVYTGFWVTRAAVKCMPPGSSIIWTVSEVIFTPTSVWHDYSASKAAVGSMVRSLSASLASKGIRVNGVAPGLVYTPLLATMGMTTEGLEQFSYALPLRRPAQPVEIATIYVDFADATKTYTSGSICQMTGGTLAFTFPS